MSHLNAEETVAGVVKAGTAKMMDSTMGKMGMAPPMMREAMGPMMGGMGSMMHDGMGPMMGGGMNSMMNEGMGSMMKSPGVATGVVVYTGTSAGKSVIRKIFTHPLVFFGLGVAAGICLYKYRKSIISIFDDAQEKE